jgi:hypothetical protein
MPKGQVATLIIIIIIIGAALYFLLPVLQPTGQPPTQPIKYSNDVITVEDIKISETKPYPDSLVEISFNIKNNGDLTIPKVEVNFFSPEFSRDNNIGKLMLVMLKCGDEEFHNTSCTFEDFESRDVKEISLLLQTPDYTSITNPTTFGIKYYIKYKHSSFRIANIPIIDGTSVKKPTIKFTQSQSSYSPIKIEFKPPVGRTITEDGKTTQEHWAVVNRPFKVEMELSHIGTVKGVYPIEIERVNLNLQKLQQEGGYYCDFTSGVEADLSSGSYILYPNKDINLACYFRATEEQPQFFGIIEAEAKYTYQFEGGQTITVQPLPTGEGAVIPPTVIPPTPTLTLKDLCTKLCAANGQTASGTAYGVCAATETSDSVVKYPGTTIDVQIQKLGSTDYSELNKALGTAATTATIKTLNLHDAKVDDARLQYLTIGQLDDPSLSVQYEKSKVKTLKSVGIVNYFCSDAIPNSMTLTLDGKTKSDLCTDKLRSQTLSNMITVNGQSGNLFKDNLLSGLKITSIAGRDIGTITGGNLTAINVEDFKVSKLSDIWSRDLESFLKYTKCDSSQPVSYSRSVECHCLIQLPAQYPKFSGVYNAKCNSKCLEFKAIGYDGGTCNDMSANGKIECSGKTTYHYGFKPFEPQNDPCENVTTDKPYCYCYDKGSLTTVEAALLCQK